MRIGIFVVMAGRQAGGPESYEKGLVRSLAGLNSPHEFTLYCLSQAAVESFELCSDRFECRVLRPSFRLASMSLHLPMLLRNDRPDLLHATFTPPPFVPVDLVFTNHCFSNFVHPEFYAPLIRLRLNHLITTGIRRAKLIVCVSQNVRDLTAEKFGLQPDQLRVVYNGISNKFRPVPREAATAQLAQYGIGARPYVLYVGKLETRKNIRRIMEAYQILREEGMKDVQLVLAGRRTPAAEDYDAIKRELKIEQDVVELGYVADANLPALYSRAELLAFPSLWEGFGIPLIEAMACGTPVLTSNISSLPEIAAGAAELVNPYSCEEIADGMRRLLSDETLRQHHRERGLERSKDFSWDKTAAGTLAAYEQAAAM